MNKLKVQIKNAPSGPGIYRFFDQKNEVLYIGKAKNLKNRLNQYLKRESLSRPFIAQMMPTVFFVDWIETDSEIEAVVLEAELIRKEKPKYNIKQKDDKSFLVLKISNDEFPKVVLDRFKDVNLKDKDYEIFGPYPSGDILRKSLKILRKIFPFYDCSKTKMSSFKKRGRTCLYGDINICPGVCLSKISKDDYRKNIDNLKIFLRGGKRRLISKFKKEMEVLAKNKNFEQASVVRDRILALENLSQVSVGVKDSIVIPQDFQFKRIEFYDISNIFGHYAVGSMVVLSDGIIDKSQYRRFRIRKPSQNDLLMIAEVLKRRFSGDNQWLRPDLIGIDGGVNQLKTAKDVLTKGEINIPVFSISKGEKRDKTDFHFIDRGLAKAVLKDQNLKKELINLQNESHRFAISYYRRVHRKETFK